MSALSWVPTVVLVARELREPVESLIRSAIAQDDLAAKAAYIRLMLAGKRVAVRKARGG